MAASGQAVATVEQATQRPPQHQPLLAMQADLTVAIGVNQMTTMHCYATRPVSASRVGPYTSCFAIQRYDGEPSEKHVGEEDVAAAQDHWHRQSSRNQEESWTIFPGPAQPIRSYHGGSDRQQARSIGQPVQSELFSPGGERGYGDAQVERHEHSPMHPWLAPPQ